MFSLAYEFDDSIEIDGFKGSVDMSFDNILRLFDLLADTSINNVSKLDTALEMLLSASFLCDYQLRSDIFQGILQEFVLKEKPTLGSGSEKESKQYYSLIEDADFIFASFMQDYGIDLFDYQGKMHWHKFKALLAGLREDTKFKKVIDIRMWEPTKDTGAEEKRNMEELQRTYALGVTQEMIEFESLSEEEKEAFARKKYEEEMRKEGG